MTTVCIWFEDNGWFWDDCEDHGGFDRISPQGPFHTRGSAIFDAGVILGCEPNIQDYKPFHYG